ncbi:MAG TPA: hypothetical protein VMI74_18880 [Burkholderiales bacterium]|nr:hypothetical protein [Burkholderiales bacterium]
MKSYLVLFLSVLIACLPASASQVTLPFTFSAGTPARAADVNANFAAVKAAVDDNFARITAAGSVSVSGQGFQGQLDDPSLPNFCGLNRGNPNVFFNSGTLPCSVFSSVSLPNGATITGLSCFVKDTFAGGSIQQASLSRFDVSTESGSVLATTGGSSDSPNIQTLSASVLANGLVDNSKYMYSIQIDFDNGGMAFSAITFGLSLYGCSVAYHP